MNINFNYKKLILLISLLLVFIYAAAPKLMSARAGLPYLHYWDEPVNGTGALNALKTSNIIPKGIEVAYGGAMRYPLLVIDFFYYQYLKIVDPTVESRADIKTYLDGVYHTTSHSGFYYWNRVYISLLNSLAFVFVFLIGRIRGGYAGGVIAVLILSSVYIYYHTSFLLNVDIPLSTWMLGTIYFALKFNHTKKRKYLTYSLICVGLAGATKYSGAVMFLIPLTAILLNRDQFDWPDKKAAAKSFLRWGGISFGVYALLNPVVIIFPDRVYKMVLWISSVYKSGGYGHFSKEPGWEHFTYQFGELQNGLGNLFIILAMAGLVLGVIMLFFRTKWKDKTNSDFLIIALFPFFYFFWITFTYSIAYHRNFYLFYPVLALLIVDILQFIPQWLSTFKNKIKIARYLLEIILVSLVIYLTFPPYSKIYKIGLSISESTEPRSKAIQTINEMAKDEKIFLGLDHNLLISPEDLRKLSVRYGYFDIQNINYALEGFTHLLVPDYQSNLQVQNFDSLMTSVKSLIEERFIKTFGVNKLFVPESLRPYEYPIQNPIVQIIRGSDFPPPKMQEFISVNNGRSNIVVYTKKPDLIFTGVLEPLQY